MLILSRKVNELIYIGPHIKLSVLEIRGNRVRLGIDAPRGVDIARSELVDMPKRPAQALPGPSQRRILIVDDCPEDRLMIRRCMAGAPQGFVFSETDMGEVGLRLCKEQTPDCVLLDYQLPDLNGLEFLTALRQDEAVHTIPVILFTGQGSEAVAVQAMKTGAHDYLVKQDISPERLQRAVYEALQLPLAN